MDAIIDGRLQFLMEVTNSRHARLADIMAKEAARVLGIEPPWIRFFYRSPAESRGNSALCGYATDDEICIADDLTEKEVLLTVLHECRHIFQRRSPSWMGRSREIRERDARLFELSWPR